MRATTKDLRGVDWDVHIEWIGRRLDDGPLLRRWHERRQQHAERKRRGRTDRDRESRWWDWLDFPAFDEGWPLFLAIVAIIVAVVLLVLVGPWLIALLLGAIELTLILIACVAAVVTRTILRRPWRVIARSSDGRQIHWQVVGWRRSRELVRVITNAIDAGVPASAIAIDRLAHPAPPAS